MFKVKASQFLYILFLLPIIHGCQKESLSNASLIGSWQVVNCSIASEELPDALVQGAIAELKSSIYTFQEEGVLLLDAKIHDEHIKGSWELNASDKVLTITHLYDHAPTVEQYGISSLKDGVLRLHQDMGGIGVMDIELLQLGRDQ